MKNRSMAIMPRLLTAALACLTIVAALACQKTQVAEFKKLQTDAEVPRISVADAKKEVDAGAAVIVDSRAEAAYKMEHVAGSINIPIGNPPERFSDLPQGKKIIVYCS